MLALIGGVGGGVCHVTYMWSQVLRTCGTAFSLFPEKGISFKEQSSSVLTDHFNNSVIIMIKSYRIQDDIF